MPYGFVKHHKSFGNEVLWFPIPAKSICNIAVAVLSCTSQLIMSSTTERQITLFHENDRSWYELMLNMEHANEVLRPCQL